MTRIDDKNTASVLINYMHMKKTLDSHICLAVIELLNDDGVNESDITRV